MEKLTMLLLFRTLDSPHEQELMKIVATNDGSKACLSNDAVLKELMMLRSGKDVANPTVGRRENFGAAERFALVQMKKELEEDEEKSLEKNMRLFERKLEVQKKQLVKEIENIVIREGDRVISALSGPHEHIIDSVSSYFEFQHYYLALLLGPAYHLEGDGTIFSISPGLGRSDENLFHSRVGKEVLNPGILFLPFMTIFMRNMGKLMIQTPWIRRGPPRLLHLKLV
jgi:hypothetical protein